MTFRILVLSATFLILAACGQKAADEPAASPTDTSTDPALASEAAPEPAAMPPTASADGASVFFIMPADRATVSNPISIEFGIAGMDVVKAGDKQPNSGHHHLLIDTGLPDLGLPIPADEHHVHFGDGSTSTEITLPPGEHTLQMLLGDHLHIPHNPPLVSGQITITVE
jgi:uncharacterized protein DUF4399